MKIVFGYFYSVIGAYTVVTLNKAYGHYGFFYGLYTNDYLRRWESLKEDYDAEIYTSEYYECVLFGVS